MTQTYEEVKSTDSDVGIVNLHIETKFSQVLRCCRKKIGWKGETKLIHAYFGKMTKIGISNAKTNITTILSMCKFI